LLILKDVFLLVENGLVIPAQIRSERTVVAEGFHHLFLGAGELARDPDEDFRVEVADAAS
jgi:hypothetical protein